MSFCHRAGAVASGTRLVFAAGASTEANYGVLRTFAAANGDLLMSKSIGLPTHSGGKPFVDANSQQYKDLASLLPKLKESCSTEVLATGQFWEAFSLRITRRCCRRHPSSRTQSHACRVGSSQRRWRDGASPNDPGLHGQRADVRCLPDRGRPRSVFGERRRGLWKQSGLNANDYPPSATAVINNQNPPAGVRARVEQGVRFEPVNIMKYIVKNDRDWREIVTGKYTVLNSITATTLGAQVQGTYMDPTNDNELLPAIMPNLRSPNGIREAAGVLVTQSFLDRFPSTDTNAHRHTVSEMSKRFIGLYIPLLASRPLEDGVFRNAVTDNPGCAVCHDVMDPMAGALQNWAPNNRYRPNGQGAAADILPNYYKSTDFMDAPKGGEYYQMGDKWFRDRKARLWQHDDAERLRQSVRSRVAGPTVRGRFPLRQRCGGLYKVLFQREVLQPVLDPTAPDGAARLAAYNAQQEEFNELAARFAAGGYKVKPC